MIPRRHLVTGGLLGGVLGALEGEAGAEPLAAAAGDISDKTLEQVAQEIGRLRTEFVGQRQFAEIAAIREAQKTYLRANGKFPDYIEVGSDIWLQAYDWHIRWQQPMTLGRDATGRYTITLLSTTVIMKIDAATSFVGLPFDGR